MARRRSIRQIRADRRLWVQAAWAMRNQGQTYNQIAAAVCRSRSTVYRALAGHRSEAGMRPERKRRWDWANRRVRCRCGDWCWDQGRVRCHRCAKADQALVAFNRRWRVEELYGKGMSVAQIATELGTTTGSIGALLRNMREAGWDLPYRHHFAKHIA